ncbi:hypothetical protein GQ53DRAFT_671598 [Thozetella sp. PMI_491]|nr:hypothetical protein GQ53DRAFT_671598 [Thozetella sp. PMI_491]
MFRHAPGLGALSLPASRAFTWVSFLWQPRYYVPRHALRRLSASSWTAWRAAGHPATLKRSFHGASGQDTIYALSSAQGRAGIAVVRISGPSCINVYRGLCPHKPLPKPRYAAVRTLVEPNDGSDVNIVDASALVLYFPGPKTVTGEDVLELHVHGGPATVKAALAAIPKCSRTGGIRYAAPGEFTQRAFLNDRLDLAQVESLGDVLSAETEQQRRAAVRGASGTLGRTYEAWRAKLLLARGEIEALIDFQEDQHFDESPNELLSNVTRLVGEMLHSIHLHEMGNQRNELLRNGIRIALLGPPNAGKSSLMNQVVGREASIVSDEAGTTRDIVEASLDIRGFLCSFADTAGIRTGGQTHGPQEVPPNTPSAIGVVEQEGIRRARKKALDSDIVIALASVEPADDGGHCISYDLETLQLAARAPERLIVINKCDVAGDSAALGSLLAEFRGSVLGKVEGLQGAHLLSISCREAEASTSGLTDPGGIHALIERLVQSFSGLTSLPSDMQDLLSVTERQRHLLVRCRGHLEDFLREAHPHDPQLDPDIVLAAEHLRFAAMSLASITGRGESGDVEEVLGVIFEKYRL